MPQIYTNQYNLPLPILNTIKNSEHEVPAGAMSATQLIKAPRQLILESRHNYYTDVTLMTKVLIGNAVHDALNINTSGHGAEELLSAAINDQVISGKPDYVADGILYDYKTTGVNSYQFGPRDSWVKQLNIYNWLLRKNDMIIYGGRIIWIFTDWSSTRYSSVGNYPMSSIIQDRIKLDPLTETEAYLKERIALHLAAKELPDSELPECTAEERWERPSKWGVKKSEQSNRFKYFDTEREAIEYGEIKYEDPYIMQIPPIQIKCNDHCPVAMWCNQYAKLQEIANETRMRQIDERDSQ